MFKKALAVTLCLLLGCAPALGLCISAEDNEYDPVGQVFSGVNSPYMIEGGLPSETEFFTDADFAQNKITVINMWDAACLHCRVELPYFQQASVEYADRGVRVIGAVSTRMGSTYATAYGYIVEFGLTFTNVIPDEGMREIIFQNASTPQTFFVDENGAVVDHILGETNYKELSRRINDLLLFSGDADCSGSLTFTDVSAVYAFALGITQLSAQGAINADFDGDGAVTFNDISLLYVALLG